MKYCRGTDPGQTVVSSLTEMSGRRLTKMHDFREQYVLDVRQNPQQARLTSAKDKGKD